MEEQEKLRALARAAAWDEEGETATTAGSCPKADAQALPIYCAAVGGRRVPLFKTLLTSACERHCAYCPFRAGRDTPRLTFRPATLAARLAALTRRGVAQGVMLSSGLAGGSIATQDRLLETAALLRRYGFQGYLHLKLMPAAEEAQIAAAMRLADRVSVNLEAPGPAYLRRLAPEKDFWEELFPTLQRAAALRRHALAAGAPFRAASLTTQFVVGAADETDAALLTWSARLLREIGVARVYYSAFRPIADTPLENHPAAQPARVRRLYRAFFLLRDYGFAPAELLPPDGQFLPADDPKTWWAQRHLREQPVELNTAPRTMLLRVPGIGPRRAEAILRARRQVTLRDLGQLQALGIPPAKAAPFVLLAGRRPPTQPSLWGEGPQTPPSSKPPTAQR